MLDKELSRCFGHPDCPMTAGFPIGGGFYQCWAHVLFSSYYHLFNRHDIVALPTMAQQREMAEHWTERQTDERINHNRKRDRAMSDRLVISAQNKPHYKP